MRWGWASRSGEARYPGLWRGLASGWVPCITGPASTVYDLVRASHGTRTNSPTTVQSNGKWALQLDGTLGTSSSSVRLPALSNDYGMTVSMWAKCTTANKSLNSMFTMQTSSAGPSLYLDFTTTSGTTQAMRLYSLGYATNSTTYTQDTNWHHYSWCWGPAGAVTYYRDGIPMGTATKTQSSSTNQVGSIGIVEGLAASGFTFSGCIDDVLLHRRVLTASEVRILASTRGAAFLPRHSVFGQTLSTYRRRLQSQAIGVGVIG